MRRPDDVGRLQFARPYTVSSPARSNGAAVTTRWPALRAWGHFRFAAFGGPERHASRTSLLARM